MTEHDQERRDTAEQLRRALASENRLTPPQARAFVRGLQVSWQVPAIQWSDAESRDQLEDARRLLHAAEIFREVEGIDSHQAKDCFRRAGELLEWLARANDSVRTIAPIELFAAAAYQLGGLPAMALGLLGQVNAPDAGTRLFSRFLKADFDGVVGDSLAFWGANRDLMRREAPAQLLLGGEPDCVEWYLTVELVRCVGLIAASLRRGDDVRLERGLLKLRALDRVATRTFSSDVSLLVSLLASVAEGYKEASIYRPLAQLGHGKPEHAPRLARFARDQFARGRGILWSSQLHGLARLRDASSFALCTPTGSGKTLVANLALIKELLLAASDEPAPLALYLVPSRALAGEVEAKLTSELGRDLVVTGLYGGADWGITDYWLTAERPTVLIATVEKADALMRYIGPLLVARLRLLIVDEAHQVATDDNDRTLSDFAEHSSRPLRLEGFVSRLLARSPAIARIALTAVAGGAAGPVAQWIEGEGDAEPIGTRYRSTRQLIGTLDATPGSPARMSLDLMNGRMLYVRGRQDPVYIPLRILPMPLLPAQMRNSLFRFNELNTLWTALHLIEGDRRVLISVAQEPEQTMKWFNEALELPEWASARRFEPPTDVVARERFDEARATCVDYCGYDSFEVALLDCGIATSHGQMPQRLRRLMTELIDRRICAITVATATLTEGVNLPFDLIFVTSLKRRSFDRDTQRPVVTPLSTAEFRNLAGRAGRPGTTRGLEGITLVAVPTHPSTTAAGQRSLQRRQMREMRTDYERLLDALNQEEQAGRAVAPLALLLRTLAERVAKLYGIEGDAFLRWLDETAPGDISDAAGTARSLPSARLADTLDELDGVLLTSLEELAMAEARVLSRAELEMALIKLWRRTFANVAAAQENWLEHAFVRRGIGVAEKVYHDAEERRRLYQYGFSPHVGRRFEAIAPGIHEILKSASDFGDRSPSERLDVFMRIAGLVANDRGFGFRVRNTATDTWLQQNWVVPLAWWMLGPNAVSPDPQQLRAWQRFVSDNLDFRLGVAIGAVVARAWSAGAENPLAVPSLDAWRQTTGLPWFGFWARELLRWGTLDPFVAFALAQGIASTRGEAAGRRPEFEAWLDKHTNAQADDRIDPQNFLAWQRSLADQPPAPDLARSISADLNGTDGRHQRYSVLPLLRGDTVLWIDPSGFELATSQVNTVAARQMSHRDDFDLKLHRGRWTVRREFHAS